MKKSFIIIYSTIASLILLFSLSYFGFNIYKEFEAGNKNCENRFDRMALSIKNIPENNDINSKEFEKLVLKSISNPNDYAYLSIKINNQDFISYPKNTQKPLKTSALVAHKERDFSLYNNKVHIEAYMHILTPAKINYYTKISFAIILFVTAITLIIILADSYKTISNKKDDEESKDENLSFNMNESSVKFYDENEHKIIEEETNFIDEPVSILPSDPIIKQTEISVEETSAPVENEEIEENIIQEVITEDTNESEPEIYTESESEILADSEIETEVVNNQTDAENQNDYVNESENQSESENETESFDINEYKNQIENDIEVELPSEEIKPMEITNEEGTPSGLFSPLTGFGWESYLNTRLDNELNRATASEIDLSVFVFKLQDIERGSDLCHKVCDYLSAEFQFRDMLFEYKEDCLVAVKIGSNIDASFTFANKLLLDIDNLLKGIGKCYIGISSRSIRMISGERILLEATEALKHAVAEEDSPVIAFRADIEKYREYLENN